jgi:hypothetical protein
MEETHMTKRTITETVYEYDKDGNLLKKTVTETHEENSMHPYQHIWPYEITCNNGSIPCCNGTYSTQDLIEKATITNKTT